MTIDLSRYDINKKFIQNWFLTQGKGSVHNSVPILACSLLVPCIVVAFYIGEIDGWSPEILRKIEVLKDFYGYKEITNKPESYPG